MCVLQNLPSQLHHQRHTFGVNKSCALDYTPCWHNADREVGATYAKLMPLWEVVSFPPRCTVFIQQQAPCLHQKPLPTQPVSCQHILALGNTAPQHWPSHPSSALPGTLGFCSSQGFVSAPSSGIAVSYSSTMALIAFCLTEELQYIQQHRGI